MNLIKVICRMAIDSGYCKNCDSGAEGEGGVLTGWE